MDLIRSQKEMTSHLKEILNKCLSKIHLGLKIKTNHLQNPLVKTASWNLEGLLNRKSLKVLVQKKEHFNSKWLSLRQRKTSLRKCKQLFLLREMPNLYHLQKTQRLKLSHLAHSRWCLGAETKPIKMIRSEKLVLKWFLDFLIRFTCNN